MLRLVFFTVLSISAASCVTDATQINAKKSTEDRLGSAFVSPLNDFNIVQTGIPPALNEAVKNPYQLPPENSCKGLIEQVELLDAALGPDLDAQGPSVKKSDLEAGGDFAQDEAVGSVQRTVDGFIPFRSWIRKLTGAERRSKDLATAVAAGVVRRAFLKGMGQERGCVPPAAPVKPAVPEPTNPPDTAAPTAAGALTTQ
jgi:hypothetical protein